MQYTRQPFEVAHPSGMVIRGISFTPVGTGRPMPAVIISHGFNGTCAPMQDRGEAYAAEGIACFMFDFRGGSIHTTSDGVLSEMMTLQTEVEDLKLIIAWVQARQDIDPDRIYLQGESQGGMVSALTAQDDPAAYPGLLLWFPALIIPEDAARRYAAHIDSIWNIRLCPDYDRLAKDVNPWSRMPEYPGRVLLLQGSDDPVVPPAVTERAASLYQHVQRIVYHGAGHGFNGKDLQDAIRTCVDFVKAGS